MDGTKQYVEGVNRLYEGAKQLEGLNDLGQVSAGVSALSGSTQQLLTGAGELSDGLGLFGNSFMPSRERLMQNSWKN